VAAAFVSFSLWIGILFSVSWVSGRARWMADDEDVGRLAAALCRRWATPCLAVSVALVGLIVGTTPGALTVGPVTIVASGGLGALALLHVSVWRRAALVARGRTVAAGGDGVRRLALVVSLGAIVAMASLALGAP